MKKFLKWIRRFFYFVVTLILIVVFIVFGIERYDKMKIHKKVKILKQDLIEQTLFTDFLSQHPDFVNLNLMVEPGSISLENFCLTANQWTDRITSASQEITFSNLLNQFQKEVANSKCRRVQVLYFNNPKGFWRASFSIEIDNEGRIQGLKDINIYR